ncbi:MAG: CZB domain-containing protein [Methylococcales bacterium]|nr:CZB domain-containing protein [Methylococcales bacterium]MDD5214444.1 CZB domain-containing protein [Methylococcales bacterium]
MDEKRKEILTLPVKNLVPIKFRRADDHHILIASHAFWKERIYNAITNKETLDISEMLNGSLSDLGHWLHDDASHPHVAKLQSYYDLRKKNSDFHLQASKVAEYINAKRYDAASRLTESSSAFEYASNAVVEAIFALKKEFDNSVGRNNNGSIVN